ncbi:hypothetical protein pb186bvf_008293 [Paramecium bursaria]
MQQIQESKIYVSYYQREEILIYNAEYSTSLQISVKQLIDDLFEIGQVPKPKIKIASEGIDLLSMVKYIVYKDQGYLVSDQLTLSQIGLIDQSKIIVVLDQLLFQYPQDGPGIFTNEEIYRTCKSYGGKQGQKNKGRFCLYDPSNEYHQSIWYKQFFELQKVNSLIQQPQRQPQKQIEQNIQQKQQNYPIKIENPIIQEQIQTNTQLTQKEQVLLKQINNAPSLIKLNIFDKIEIQKNNEYQQIIQQEKEILLDNFQYRQIPQKNEDKPFKIMEQQKYHKIENAIKRRILENKQNNKIIDPLTINQKQVVEDKNQELVMFALADQVKNSGKVLYQCKEAEELNIFSLQASFSDQCEDTICEELTLQETPQLTFNQLRDDNIQEKKFYASIREILAKQYNVRPEDVNILSIESGSIKVLYKITGNYSDAEKAKEYTLNEIKRQFPGSNPVLVLHKFFESIQLSPNDFDPTYNREWDGLPEYQLRGPPNDQIKYFFPKGWKGYALKVKGKFDNGNDDWLKIDNNPNQWHIMFHGTNNLGCQGIQQTGFRAGDRQAYSSSTDIRFNSTIGVGIYFSNHIEVCEMFSKSTTIDNHQYKVVYLSRVRPTSLKQARKSSSIPGKSGNSDWDNDYFVVNKPEDIRPFRILLKKL